MATKVRFYTDAHIAKAVARGLSRRGVDVLTAQEAGLLDATDEEHLQRAGAEGRVLLTQDSDYLRLHASGADHAGIAYAPQGTSIGNLVRGSMLIYEVLDADHMRGHLEYI